MTKTTLTTSTLFSGIAAAALLLPGCTTYVPNQNTGTALGPKNQPQTNTQPTGGDTVKIETIETIEQKDETVTINLVGGNRVTNMTPEEVRALTNVVAVPPAQVLRDGEKTETYVVKKGDTLIEIANKHGLTSKEFIKLNDIKDPNKLRVGQKFQVPAGRAALTVTPRSTTPVTPREGNKVAVTPANSKEAPKDGYKYHTVEKGDSLSVIAQKHGVKTAEVAEWNGIQTTSILRVGQHLRVNNTRGNVPPKTPTPIKEDDETGVNESGSNVGDEFIGLLTPTANKAEDGAKRADNANVANNLGKDNTRQVTTAPKTGKTYTTTEENEDVFSISYKHKVLWREIVSANPGLLTTGLPVGTVVNIPETAKK